MNLTTRVTWITALDKGSSQWDRRLVGLIEQSHIPEFDLESHLIILFILSRLCIVVGTADLRTTDGKSSSAMAQFVARSDLQVPMLEGPSHATVYLAVPVVLVCAIHSNENNKSLSPPRILTRLGMCSAQSNVTPSDNAFASRDYINYLSMQY